jgi:hypothetical protein
MSQISAVLSYPGLEVAIMTKDSWGIRLPGAESIKRQTAKLARHLGKRLLEDAPRRVTRGYAD